MSDTRARILGEAMRLFGELGYAATTIAKIEEAAGLSPGSGALYKHFRSKKDILGVGLRERICKKDTLTTLLGTEAPPPTVSDGPRVLLRAVAKSGLERLAYERDVNRILVRDLAAFPELLEEFRTAEVARNHAAVTQLLQAHATAHATPGAPGTDWSAVAAILQDALSHYWLMADIYGGTHPTGVTEDAYLDTLTDLALALVPISPPQEES